MHVTRRLDTHPRSGQDGGRHWASQQTALGAEPLTPAGLRPQGHQARCLGLTGALRVTQSGAQSTWAASFPRAAALATLPFITAHSRRSSYPFQRGLLLPVHDTVTGEDGAEEKRTETLSSAYVLCLTDFQGPGVERASMTVLPPGPTPMSILISIGFLADNIHQRRETTRQSERRHVRKGGVFSGALRWL